MLHGGTRRRGGTTAASARGACRCVACVACVRVAAEAWGSSRRARLLDGDRKRFKDAIRHRQEDGGWRDWAGAGDSLAAVWARSRSVVQF